MSELATIETALVSARSWIEARNLLEAGRDRGALWGSLADALAFRLEEVTGDKGARLLVFVPLGQGAQLPDVDEAVEAYWAEVADTATNVFVRARVNDLLWERRRAPAHEHGRRAAVAYLAVADEGDVRLPVRCVALNRAAVLGRVFGDTEILEQASAQANALLKVEVAAEHIGSVERLLRVLQRTGDPSLESWWAPAKDAFGADHYGLDRLLELRHEMATDGRADAACRLLDHRLAVADAHPDDALARLLWLEKAHETATSYVPGRASKVSLLIQAIKPDDISTITVSEEFEVSGEARDAYLAEVFAAPDAVAALQAFALLPPLGGTDDEADAGIADQLQGTLLGTMTHDYMGSVSAAPIGHLRPGTHQRREADRALIRSLDVGVMSLWVANALAFVVERHAPDDATLTRYFTRPHIDETRARRIARAFRLYAEGHSDDAAHVVLPRIEAALRTWCDQGGLPVIVMPSGDDLGRSRTLGGLLDAIAPDLGPLRAPHLVHVLTSRFGPGLRNNVLHGNVAEVSRLNAALLLHIVCLVAEIPPKAALDAHRDTES